MRVLLFCAVTALSAQSHDLRTEKAIVAALRSAIAADDYPTLLRECDQVLATHQINALIWYLCGKHALFAPQPDAQSARANLHTAYNRLLRAAEDFARTAKQTYYTLDALQYLGLAAMLMGEDDRAITHFKAALLRDNRVQAAWYNLGVLYERKGLREEAMRAWHRYLRLKNLASEGEF
ncbi:MAG: hypothetical protein N2Z22_05180 [Turneriella sp.]|nr:hypothetical protein [Turneriella sp.]